MNRPFPTIAGRLRHHLDRSGLDRVLGTRELSMVTAIFYSGFSAALDAMTEAAAFPEEDACQLMKLMHDEVESFTRAAVAEMPAQGGVQ